jgi:outer membrane protein assembly factor BamB
MNWNAGASQAGAMLDGGTAQGAVDPESGAPAGAATVPAFALIDDPQNVLAQLGCVSMPGAVLARVHSSDGTSSLATPFMSLRPDGLGAVSVLGLAPSTTYAFSLQMLSPDGVIAGPTLSATTSALPPDLAALQITTTGTPSSPSGYYLISGAGNYSAAFDKNGTFRWYRGFGSPTQEAKMHSDGTFTTYVGKSSGSQPVAGTYVRYTPDGTQIATYSAASPDPSDPSSPIVYTDPHELLITTNDAGEENIHIFGYALHPRSASDPTLAAWHQLQRQREDDGTVEFRWKISDYFTANDETLGGVATSNDIDHANAIDIDPRDGNYVLSLRNFNAVVKIDYTTGSVLWQFGGIRNQFALVDDPLGGFMAQHSARVLENGNILLYDDGPGHSPPESRAVEYRLDTAAMTATMVWQFRHSPAIYTQVTGSVERLQNGNTLVGFAFAGTADEVDANGHVLWEARITKGMSAATTYRVRRLPSLYAFATP